MNLQALDTSKSVVVEACAGSGKTWLLSSRIARAILEGTPPRSILALTFTNKAAAEMRTRVVSHLKEMATLASPQLEAKLRSWGLTGEALTAGMLRAPRVFAEFLTDPQPPTISTFHSWYSRVAAMAPVSMAGLATMSLSQRPWDLMRQAWQIFFSETIDQVPYAPLVGLIGEPKTKAAMESWVQSRVEWKAFAGQLKHLNLRAEQASKALENLQPDNEAAVRRFYTEQAPRAAFLASAYKDSPKREEFYAVLSAWERCELERLCQTFLTKIEPKKQSDHTPPKRHQLKGGDDKFVRKTIDLPRWGAQAARIADEVTALGHALKQLLDETDQRIAQARTQALWVCGQALGRCLDQVMAQSHEIDFSGLELTAWKLLAGPHAPAFHARLDTRYRHILVDEFQDTNPTQWAMLKAWLEQYDQADPDLREQAPKVFLVGDPKQSIYRFRRADPEIFQIATDWLGTHFGAEKLQTHCTRRCGPEVVEFLNRAMPAFAHSGRFSPHETLAAENRGIVARLPIAEDWSQEGDQIARALHQIRHQRPEIKWSDVRILVRSRTHMQPYEAALAKAGIAFVSDRSGGLLNEPEVLDVIALLRFLAFPWSDIDCAHALKSPLFALSDTALAQIVVGQSSAVSHAPLFEKLKSHHSPESQQIALTLGRWIDWSARLPVHDLLDRIVHEHDLFDRMAARFAAGRGLQCIANLESFIALALDLDTGRLPSLPKFLQELGRWSAVSHRDAPGPGVMPNIDAVSLSTMHGAKGLEAKVVVLAGLLDREKSDSGLRWLIDWNANRDAIQHLTTWQPGDPFSEAVIKALGEEERQSRDEDFNLLYVGVTRAKNILLFSATKGKKDFSETWFGRIMDYCDAWDFGSASVHDDAAVSAVNAHWPGLLLPKRERDDSPVSTAETLAIRKGKALHRLLEFGTRLQPQLAARLIAEFALPRQSEAEVMEAVDRIGSTEFGQTIFDPGLLAYAEQEWPLDSEQGTLMRPDRVVRVACSPECWWIIDFKWQVLETEQADYAMQLATYQSVFQRIRPQAKVSAKIITAHGDIWELQVGSGQNRICRIPDARSRSPGEFAG